jgi:hypothetical protein
MLVLSGIRSFPQTKFKKKKSVLSCHRYLERDLKIILNGMHKYVCPAKISICINVTNHSPTAKFSPHFPLLLCLLREALAL